MEKCCICKETTSDGKPTNVLQKKGSDRVNKASVQRGSKLVTTPGEIVHVECRRKYCKTQNIARDTALQQRQTAARCELRSKQSAFNFQEHCLFCGQIAKTDRRLKELDVFPARTDDFQESVIQICQSRNDK